MARPRLAAAALVAAVALVLAGCGGSSEDAAQTPVATVSPGDTLVGSVGTEEDPDAFVIALTDEAGAPVTEAPAGDYTLHIIDPSTIHNFRFVRDDGSGPDVQTEVEEVTEETIELTLEPGGYGYVCVPHSGQMNGSLEVAA